MNTAMTRRQMLTTAGLLGAALRSFCDLPSAGFLAPPASSANRLPISTLADNQKALLINAYCKLKELPQHHPWSLAQQTSLHMQTCSGSSDIHNTWSFLSWHRCFIYFHERILARLVKDENFRLPYWDWDVAPQIPFFYINSSPDNPLYRMRYKNPVIAPGVTCGNIRAMLSPVSFEGTVGYGGSTILPGTACTSRPHSSIHNAVSADMGDPAKAASDPLFYIHHANVDRFWQIWTLMQGGSVAYQKEWLSKSYFFPDENNRPIPLRTADVVNIDNLKYGYDNYRTCFSFTPAFQPLRFVPIHSSGVQFDRTAVQILRAAMKRPPERLRPETPEIYVTFAGLQLMLDRTRSYYLYLIPSVRGAAPLRLGPFSPFQQIAPGGSVRAHVTIPLSVQSALRLKRGFSLRYSTRNVSLLDAHSARPANFDSVEASIRFFVNN